MKKIKIISYMLLLLACQIGMVIFYIRLFQNIAGIDSTRAIAILALTGVVSKDYLETIKKSKVLKNIIKGK